MLHIECILTGDDLLAEPDGVDEFGELIELLPGNLCGYLDYLTIYPIPFSGDLGVLDRYGLRCPQDG